jgi:hypothetical protein
MSNVGTALKSKECCLRPFTKVTKTLAVGRKIWYVYTVYIHCRYLVGALMYLNERMRVQVSIIAHVYSLGTGTLSRVKT